MSDELQRKVLERVLAQTQLTRADQKLPDAIRVKHGINHAGKRLHYYFNFSVDPELVSYPYAGGVELLSNRPVTKGAEISLEPWGVVIVER